MKASILKRLFTNIVETNSVDQLKRDILDIGLLNLDKALIDVAEKYSGKNSKFYKELSWFVVLNVLNVFDSYCEVFVVRRDLHEYVKKMFVHTLNEKSRFVKDLFFVGQYWKQRRVNAGKEA